MEKWIKGIDEVTALVKENFGDLTEEQLNWKPNGETWSIAQHLHHLIVINSSYFPIIEALEKVELKIPFYLRIPALAKWMGNMIYSSVKPEQPKKIKTFEIWEPSTSTISADILDRFEAHQQSLKDQVQHAEELVRKGSLIHSPANNKIVYTLEKAFDIIVAHEMRHFNHAMGIKSGLPEQAASDR